MGIEWVIGGGFAVIIALLSWIGNILWVGLDGLRKDLAGFQLSTEKRLTAAETSLSLLRVK